MVSTPFSKRRQKAHACNDVATCMCSWQRKTQPSRNQTILYVYLPRRMSFFPDVGKLRFLRNSHRPSQVVEVIDSILTIALQQEMKDVHLIYFWSMTEIVIEPIVVSILLWAKSETLGLCMNTTDWEILALKRFCPYHINVVAFETGISKRSPFLCVINNDMNIELEFSLAMFILKTGILVTLQ